MLYGEELLDRLLACIDVKSTSEGTHLDVFGSVELFRGPKPKDGALVSGARGGIVLSIGLSVL